MARDGETAGDLVDDVLPTLVLGEWRSNMPVWAHRELWKIRQSNHEYLDGRPTGPVIGGAMADLPSKVWEGALLPPSQTYLVRIESDRGKPLDLLLWREMDFARWWGETPEERAAAQWPNDDVITGWPDHYIVNGDTSSCGCGRHEVSAEPDVR